MASPGCSLPDLVGPRQLYGADVLPILEQLTEELAAATADGTLPEALGVDQVWVQTSGRVQLLDTPTGPPPHQVETGDKRALDFLAHVARFMLMRDLSDAANNGPVHAPLPRFAAQLLGRLTGAGPPFPSLSAFRAALEETRERPVEVTRTRRGFHLVLLLALLLPGLVGMFGSIPFVLASFFVEHQRTLMTCDKLAQPPCSNTEKDDLQRRKAAAEREQAGAMRSLSWFLRPLAEHSRDLTERQVTRKHAEQPPTAVDYSDSTSRKPHSVIATENYGAMCFLILACPAMWILWGGLTRGGFSLRFAGIQLVQADGRRAGRWRCAYRAALVWLPIISLLCIAGCLEVWRLNHDVDGDLPAWLAWGSWWLAAGLLPLFLWLAQRTPNRGPHDRLAGTFLVPR